MNSEKHFKLYYFDFIPQTVRDKHDWNVQWGLSVFFVLFETQNPETWNVISFDLFHLFNRKNHNIKMMKQQNDQKHLDLVIYSEGQSSRKPESGRRRLEQISVNASQ